VGKQQYSGRILVGWPLLSQWIHSLWRWLLMAKPALNPAIRYLRHVFADQGPRDRTDGELLRDFLVSNDQHSFAQLVKRHAAMVLGMCRHVLHHEQDAEDAFQATFLILARQASRIRKHESLASWLHGVAYHMANDARKAATRRRRHEEDVAVAPSLPTPGTELAWREVRAILDEEIERLPIIYREPFILCCVENRSCAEVGQTLRLKEGTVWSRVIRAKKRLQAQLSKRDVSLTVLLSAAAVSSGNAMAAVPAGLIGATAAAALEMVTGPGLSAATISPNVAALIKGMTNAVACSQFKATMAVIIGLGIITAGLGVAAARWLPAPAAPVNSFQEEKAHVQRAPVAPKPQTLGVDRFDDALPPGVIGRLGTVRLRHGSMINQIVFAPDGKSLISAAHDGFVHTWETGTGKELLQLDLNELQRANQLQRVSYFLGADQAHSLSVSPDGKALAAACMNSPPRIWDLASGRVLHVLGGDQVRAGLVEFSHDSKIVAYGGGRLINGTDDLDVTLADATTGQEIRRLVGHKGKIDRFAFSNNDRYLVSGSQDGTVRFWDVQTGTEAEQFEAYAFALSPAGKTVAICGKDESVWVCTVGTRNELRKLDGNSGQQLTLLFAPDGKTLLGDSRSKAIFQTWDVATGRTRIVQEPEAPPRWRGREYQAPTLFTPDSKLVVRGYPDGFIRIWDAATGQCVRQFQAHKDGVRLLALSADGKVLASTQHSSHLAEATVKLWDASTGKALARPEVADATVGMLAFSPDGNMVAASSWDGTTRIADAATGKLIHALPTFGPMAFMPDGKTLATGGWRKGDLRLWNLTTFKEEAFGSHDDGIMCLALSRNGKRLVTQGHDSIRLWNVASRRVIHEFGGKQPSHILQCALSADGTIMASTSQDNNVSLWETGSGKLLWKHQEEDFAHGIAVSPEGRLVTWAARVGHGRAYPIRVADTKTGKVLCNLSGDWAPSIYALAFSADGRTIFGGGNFSNRVQIWEVATGRQRTLLKGHTGSITSLATSPDGSLLASGSTDTTTLIWDLTGGHEPGDAGGPALPQARLDELWQALDQGEAATAYESMQKLRQHPKEAIELFRKQLHPIARVDEKQVLQYIRDLDSNSFPKRERARNALEKLAEAAEGSLRGTLESKPSAEVIRHVEDLLKKLEGPGRLRQDRALEVLEWIGDDPAKESLKSLADGAPNAWLTQEARASLDRLAMRSRD
jgi:RNA polymerase sigma factor (sigma-70 family)